MISDGKTLGVRVERDLWDRLQVEAERLTEGTGIEVSISDVVRMTLRKEFPKDGAENVVPRGRIELPTP